jgi:DNA modification methylase
VTTAIRLKPRLLGLSPIYETNFGSAYLGDAQALLKLLPDNSINLIVTSPPYALETKKSYGNADKSEFVEWFKPFGREMLRVLTPDGSLILNIGGSYNAGVPTRSLYHFRLLLSLCDDVGFQLAQECFWLNPCKAPAPAEWVCVRRVRIKDSIEYVWWLSKTDNPKADNRNVLVPYSDAYKSVITKGNRKNKQYPSGHRASASFAKDRGGSIPQNVLIRGNSKNDLAYKKACADKGIKEHPARFPLELPEFYIKMLTNPGDLVLDPFAGSNTTGVVAERLNRRWMAFELYEPYLLASSLRFKSGAEQAPDDQTHTSQPTPSESEVVDQPQTSPPA